MMNLLQQLSDDEIDDLLLLLFNGSNSARSHPIAEPKPRPQSIRDFTHDELLRVRSRNHPDKWPNVNAEAYQAAVEELDRRRQLKIR